jgi:uncharacterized membrane protein
MKKSRSKSAVCQICGKSGRRTLLVPAEMVRSGVIDQISKSHPGWAPEGNICIDDLNRYRAQYIETLLETEKGELTSLEKEVLESLEEHEVLASDVNKEFEKDLTFGERLADRIADFGGSWTFIALFLGFLLFWVALNSVVLLRRPFDPYPFILLNLFLSCLAAIQAPVIMMSQNRLEERDRLRGEYDYRVNLKAELEIRQLHEKIDHLLWRQWERLVEIQEIQLDLMNEITRKTVKRGTQLKAPQTS